MSVEGIYGFIGARYVLAPNSKIQIGPMPGINSANIKATDLGASGVVEVMSNTQVLGASFGDGCTTLIGGATCISTLGPTFGNGYPISLNEIFCANLSGPAYLYTSGNTCTIAIAFGRSQGFQGT